MAILCSTEQEEVKFAADSFFGWSEKFWINPPVMTTVISLTPGDNPSSTSAGVL